MDGGFSGCIAGGWGLHHHYITVMSNTEGIAPMPGASLNSVLFGPCGWLVRGLVGGLGITPFPSSLYICCQETFLKTYCARCHKLKMSPTNTGTWKKVHGKGGGAKGAAMKEMPF